MYKCRKTLLSTETFLESSAKWRTLLDEAITNLQNIFGEEVNENLIEKHMNALNRIRKIRNMLIFLSVVNTPMHTKIHSHVHVCIAMHMCAYVGVTHITQSLASAILLQLCVAVAPSSVPSQCACIYT
jgi:hypothetical protein